MSSKIKGLRRVGIVGLSTVVAASMMTLSGVSASAAAGDYTAVSVTQLNPAVLTTQVAGNLTLEFANSWATGAAQTFTVGSNDCSTPAGRAAAIRFANAPTATVTDPAPTNTAGFTTPSFTVTTGSSNATCLAAGINDRVTITQGLPSSGTATDTWLVTLTNVNYLITATTPKGSISVATAGAFKASGSVVNAAIPNATFTNSPRVAALPGSDGVSLGTQTFAEGTAGAFFPTALQTVRLTLTAGTFTPGITPTITAPAGYVVTKPATAAVAQNFYEFTVTGPATPIAAVVTVSGLTASVNTTVSTRTLTATGLNGFVVAPVSVVNVLNYTARIGGATRYETAAALFSSTFGPVETTEVDLKKDVTSVVLSGGALFPDALSANYLAGKLGTGTLLTTPSALSTAARTAIINARVSTVYITGLTGAVSQGVENTIEAMHVGNSPAAPFITTVRLGGATRYETNMLVNEFNFTPSNTVLLAAGTGFADALALGPIAYNGDVAVAGAGYPLIITRGVTLGTTENTQLADFNPTNVVIAGGTGVVSAAIETSLRTQGYTVLRLAGQDRTLTAAAIASWATDGILNGTRAIDADRNFSSATTHVTTGTGFADALAAGPVAGFTGTLIVLSASPTVVGAGITSYLGDKAVGSSPTTVGTLNALGLTGATSNALMKAAAATIGTGL